MLTIAETPYIELTLINVKCEVLQEDMIKTGTGLFVNQLVFIFLQSFIL